MNFLVICRDIEDSAELRLRHLDAHLHYVDTMMTKIQVAGPLTDKGTGLYRSSCFIYEASSEEEASSLIQGDPYCQAGIYQQVTIEAFKPVAGQWVGGKNW